MAKEKELAVRECAMQFSEKESTGSLSEIPQIKMPDDAQAIISSKN